MAIVGILAGCLGLIGGLVLARRWDKPSIANTGREGRVAEAATNGAAATAVPGSGLGVSRDQLQAALASPSLPRFIYREAGAIDGQPRITGTLGNDLAQVELIGPAENIAQARLVLQLTSKTTAAAADQPPETELTVQDATYMVLLAREVAPHWDGASQWLEECLPQAAHGVAASTTQGNVQLSLSRIDKFGLVMLTAAPK